MTAFLVAKPSVLLRQLAEGPATPSVSARACFCVGAWRWLAWREGVAGRRGGMDGCTLGKPVVWSKFAWGREEGSWLWQCVQTEAAEGKAGRVCVWGCAFLWDWGGGVHACRELGLQDWGVGVIRAKDHIPTALQMCVCAHQGGALLWRAVLTPFRAPVSSFLAPCQTRQVSIAADNIPVSPLRGTGHSS